MLWRLGNGKEISCWEDEWIPEVGRLREHANSSVSSMEASYTIANLVMDHGGWCLDNSDTSRYL